MIRPAVAFVLLVSSLSAPALATAKSALDLPAGRLGDSVAALGQQDGASIVVDTPALWQRATPALKGRYTIEVALKRLLAGSGAEAVPVPGDGWRIRTAARKPVRHAAPPPVPSAGETD